LSFIVFLNDFWMSEVLDYMIVGQGLAGSAVAMHLHSLNKKILVIDNPTANRSSVVAAGLVNPLTGRIIKKTWAADELFPYLHAYYRNCEQVCESDFFHEVPIYRPFLSIEEQNEWIGKSADQSLTTYVKSVFTQAFSNDIKNPLGGILLAQSGYLNTGAYLAAVRAVIQSRHQFIDQQFNEAELRIQTNGVEYQTWKVKTIIFCQGTESLKSRFWKWLPIKPMKGETLQIKVSSKFDFVPNRGVYVVPFGDSSLVGATYSYQDQQPTITEPAKAELIGRTTDLLAVPFTVTGQNWGFRPTTPDRKPILGRHPQYPQLVFFNGLGTKGVSLAPTMAKSLINYLENGVPINKVTDISRYYSLYSGFTS